MPVFEKETKAELLASSGEQVHMFHSGGTTDYNPVAHGFLVEEETITKVEAGEYSTEWTLVTSRDASVIRSRWFGARSTGLTVLDPDYVGFAIPLAWSGKFIINGEPVKNTSVYVPMETYCVQGGDRDTIGVVLRREKFIDTVAALSGTGPESVDISHSALQFTRAAIGRLRRQILNRIVRTADDSGRSDSAFEKDLFGLLADYYLDARPNVPSHSSRVHAPERIVRKAEERFRAAQGTPISLADLCAAAGVRKSTLYQAFHTVYGDTPLAYFRKRQLMNARSRLVRTVPARGAVKHAALSAGLTELGRFAGEYRRLFGESPSATLHKCG